MRLEGGEDGFRKLCNCGGHVDSLLFIRRKLDFVSFRCFCSWVLDPRLSWVCLPSMWFTKTASDWFMLCKGLDVIRILQNDWLIKLTSSVSCEMIGRWGWRYLSVRRSISATSNLNSSYVCMNNSFSRKYWSEVAVLVLQPSCFEFFTEVCNAIKVLKYQSTLK